MSGRIRLLVILGFALVAVALWRFQPPGSWVDSGTKSPRPAEPLVPELVPAPAAVPGAPGTVGKLQFDAELRDVPVAPDAQQVVVDFGFANTSGRPIAIRLVEKNCTCISVEISGGKLRYESGQGGVIRATFQLDNLTGEVEKSCMLYLEGDPDNKPSHTLTALLRIPELVKLSQKSLKWELGGKLEPQKIDIEMAYTKPIRVVSTSCSSDKFRLDLKAIEDGRRYQLWVTPGPAAETGLGLIRVETDCEIPRHRVQQAFALIRKPPPVEVTPGTP